MSIQKDLEFDASSTGLDASSAESQSIPMKTSKLSARERLTKKAVSAFVDLVVLSNPKDIYTYKNIRKMVA